MDLKLIIWLINNGASFIEPDSDGQTPLIHAIKSNNFEIVKGIISYMNAEKINYRSSNGWTALNYIVSPFPAGSYENLELFKLLVD